MAGPSRSTVPLKEPAGDTCSSDSDTTARLESSSDEENSSFDEDKEIEQIASNYDALAECYFKDSEEFRRKAERYRQKAAACRKRLTVRGSRPNVSERQLKMDVKQVKKKAVPANRKSTERTNDAIGPSEARSASIEKATKPTETDDSSKVTSCLSRDLDGVSYVGVTDLQPLDKDPNPSDLSAIENGLIVKDPNDDDWHDRVETLNTVRRIARYHGNAVEDEGFLTIMYHVIELCGSNRSGVSKTALMTLHDVYLCMSHHTHLKKALLKLLQESITASLDRAIDKSTTISDEATTTLTCLCQKGSYNKALFSLSSDFQFHKRNKDRQVKIAYCYAVIIKRIGKKLDRTVKEATLNNAISTIVDLTAAARPEAREFAKATVTFISE